MELRRVNSSTSKDGRGRRKGNQKSGVRTLSSMTRSNSANSFSSCRTEDVSFTSGLMAPISSHTLFSDISNSRDYRKSNPKIIVKSGESFLKSGNPEMNRPSVVGPTAKPSDTSVSQPSVAFLGSVQYQVSVLREKYSKLKVDYNAKVEEVSFARVELGNAIRSAVEQTKHCEEMEKRAADLMLRVKDAEFEKIKFATSRDKVVEVENQLTLSKQKYIESLEGAEEASAVLQQQREAVDRMRQMYIETEQIAEEQSRKLKSLAHENERLTQQIELSMDQAREQFQNQVFELGPMADCVERLNKNIMLNKEKENLANQKSEQLQTLLSHYNDKNSRLKSELVELRNKSSKMNLEKDALRKTIKNNQSEKSEAKAEYHALRAKIKEMEELNNQKEAKIRSKESEIEDTSARLETLREECARQISSYKSALLSTRKNNLKHLTSLEKDLAGTKVDESAAARERDEIRRRLEEQIASLSQNLFQAKEKIKTLQDSLGYINNDRNIKVRRSSPFTKR